jgi:hypothetical protein
MVCGFNVILRNGKSNTNGYKGEIREEKTKTKDLTPRAQRKTGEHREKHVNHR